jgi:aryl-alcohol dehydrogenase-like predicted oxidoreductase
MAAVSALRQIVPSGQSMSQFALRWILMHPAVTCAIPGAKRPQQAEENIKAAELPPISEKQMAACEEIYNRLIRPLVHQKW